MPEIPKEWVDRIICGDCVEEMKKFPNESIDLVVTSPPYDNLRDYKGYIFNFEEIAKELTRVLKQGGVIVWVVGDSVVNGSETGQSFKQALFFKDELGLNIHDTMIYEKNGCPYPDKTRYLPCFEYMFVLSKGFPKTVHLLADRKNRWDKSFGKVSNRQKDGSLKIVGIKTFKNFGVRFNIWRINCGFGRTTLDVYAFKHPAMFPEVLARDHILSWSDPGQIILDPMCGSGTTCKMAKNFGRKFIGIDISPDYCKIAERRLANVIPDMFLSHPSPKENCLDK